MPLASAPLVSRYTYRLHLQAMVLEGVLGGVLVTSDVVARKSLGAGPWQIVFLTMAPAALQVLALAGARWTGTRDRRRLFLAGGVAGRLVLLAVCFVFTPGPFLAVMVAHGLVQAVLVPAQNAVYQSNYAPAVRGRLFGRASTYGGLATAAVAFATGYAMDHDAEAYRWLYPLAGAAGFAACLVFGGIRLRRHPPGRSADAPGTSPWAVVREALVRDAAFRRFEVAMFVYGLGFMVMQPVFAPFFVDELGMDYSDASHAKGVVFYGVHIAALGYAGRLLDRIGLERLAMRACGVLAAFAAALALARTPGQAVAAFALYGLGMAGLNIAWSMGPVQYAPPGGAPRYMGVHVALVGLRAVAGQPLGGAVAQACGSARAAFALAVGFFVLASWLMRRAGRMRDERATLLHA